MNNSLLVGGSLLEFELQFKFKFRRDRNRRGTALTSLNYDDQNPIRGGLHIIDSLVLKILGLRLSHTIIFRRRGRTFRLLRMDMGIIIH